jgi:hypothetical protein
LLRTSSEIKFKPTLPSTNIFVTLRLRIVDETNNGKQPTAVVQYGWSLEQKIIGMFEQLRGF